jgi:hypothetical protein
MWEGLVRLGYYWYVTVVIVLIVYKVITLVKFLVEFFDTIHRILRLWCY